jgi:hypothetical protein
LAVCAILGGQSRKPLAAFSQALTGVQTGKERPNAYAFEGEYMVGLLWTIIVVLFALWLIGLLMHIGGGLIHILLLVVLVLVVFNLLTGRGARV